MRWFGAAVGLFGCEAGGDQDEVDAGGGREANGGGGWSVLWGGGKDGVAERAEGGGVEVGCGGEGGDGEVDGGVGLGFWLWWHHSVDIVV